MKAFFKSFIFFLVFSCAFPASAQSPRSGTREWSLQPFLVGSRTYTFEAGARARIDGGAGVGLGLGRNLNDYFAIGVDASVGVLDYRATVVPGAGNAGPAFDSTGTMDRGTLHFHGTWYLLSSRTTPFLTAGLGATHLDPDLEAAPPAAGCWIYPWWGQFCGAEPPTHGITRFSYSAAVGVRHDYAEQRGFLRFLVGGEWIDWSGPPDRVASIQFRADFGLRF